MVIGICLTHIFALTRHHDSASSGVFLLVRLSEQEAVLRHGVLDLVQFQHVLVDGARGLEATHSGGELRVLGRLWVDLGTDGTNDFSELLAHLADKISGLILRSSSHDNSTISNLDFGPWNRRADTL